MDPRIYWVGFNLVKGIGAVRLQALLDYFGNLEVAWSAPADGLVSAGLPPKIVEAFVKMRRSVDLERIWAHLEEQGIQALTREDEGYPRRLREIDQPPPVIYVRGELLAEDDFAVAVVGTRRVTPYGRQVASELASYLGANGVTVVSGLARGVDAIAHDAVMKAGGRTIAVLGCGVDRIYPPEHERLAGQIMARGALVSDYAPGTPPDSTNFPPRNRIISGLSMATVVIEAGETSGALITATFAVEQGREVFALPGSILAPQSKGTNRLIQLGAHPLLEMRDVLEILQLQQVQQQVSARRSLPADGIEARLLSILGNEAQHIDDILIKSGLPIEQVSATLAIMELKGMVHQLGGMNYVSVRENYSQYSIENK
ncbi:DNA-protecting protein DprA [bacterium]|nr:MAG: DNA-protecting protein DprA [bacterium]